MPTDIPKVDLPVSLRSNHRALAFGVAALVVIIDQVTKHWALGSLVSPGTTMALPGPVDLTLIMNHSNAFGLVPVRGEISRWGLAAVNVAVAAGLAAAIVTRPYGRLTALGFGFTMAGAVGNAIDRVLLGAVVDFIDASKLGFVWVFNVADAALDVGIGFFILGWVISERRAESIEA